MERTKRDLKRLASKQRNNNTLTVVFLHGRDKGSRCLGRNLTLQVLGQMTSVVDSISSLECPQEQITNFWFGRIKLSVSFGDAFHTADEPHALKEIARGNPRGLTKGNEHNQEAFHLVENLTDLTDWLA